MPPAVDAREGSGDARQARPRRARQPQVHVRGPASNSRARQGDSTRRKRVPRRTRSKGRRRRRRRRQGGGGHGTRTLGEPAKRGAAPAAATRALGQDLENPGGALAGRPRRRVRLSAGSSAPSPARGFPLARLTAVENGADRTPPTIGSSRGSDGTGRSVAGERPRTERPPALSDFKLQTSNFKRASTEPHPAPALPPSIRNSRRVRSNRSSSGAPGDASSTARRRRAASLELEDTAAFPAPPGTRADDDEDSWDEYFRVSSEWISKDESPGVGPGRRLSMNAATFTP